MINCPGNGGPFVVTTIDDDDDAVAELHDKVNNNDDLTGREYGANTR
jgi:hypothetical protein